MKPAAGSSEKKTERFAGQCLVPFGQPNGDAREEGGASDDRRDGGRTAAVAPEDFKEAYFGRDGVARSDVRPLRGSDCFFPGSSCSEIRRSGFLPFRSIC